jgi:hypothetical protein
MHLNGIKYHILRGVIMLMGRADYTTLFAHTAVLVHAYWVRVSQVLVVLLLLLLLPRADTCTVHLRR